MPRPDRDPLACPRRAGREDRVATSSRSRCCASGKSVQSFPEYGPERRGAPLRAYTRFSTQPVRRHDSDRPIPTSSSSSTRRCSHEPARRPRERARDADAACLGQPVARPPRWRTSRCSAPSRRALGEPPLETLQDAAVEILGGKIAAAEALRAAVRRGYRWPQLKHLDGAAGRGRARAGRRAAAGHRRLAHARAGPSRSSSACVNCLLCWLYCPDSAIVLDGTTLRRHRLRLLQGLRALRRGLPGRRDLDGAGGRMSTLAPRLLTGGEAVAHAMRQIEPDVVPVYPITPQTPIIQTFSTLVADGAAHTEIVNVESEHSAMSAAIGSALAGARTMTATSSQGLALMAEVVYIAASMRAPIVMAVGNRALSGPINIHCDHSDSMLIRDSGVVQLFAENAQEAYDLMVMAPRIAEHPDVLLPVLVCQDGFTITHAAEPVELLADDDGARVRRRVPRSARPLLDVGASRDARAVRDARLLLRVPPRAGGGARARLPRHRRGRRRVRPALRPRATTPSSRTGSTVRTPVDRRARLDRRHGQGRRRRAAGRGRAGRPRSRSARSAPSRPTRSARLLGDVARGDRARPRRLARRRAAARRGASRSRSTATRHRR